MIEWTLRTRLSTGLITVKGRIDGEDVVFDHPTEEGEILLRVSIVRCEEIAAWPPYRQSKMNMTIERKVIHVGKEFDRPALPYEPCTHCKAPITIIDEDFHLHALPFCREWILSDMKIRKPVFETQPEGQSK